MAIDIAAYTGAVTIGASEVSLVSGTTTLSASTAVGIFQAKIDFSAMAAGDQYRIRFYEKARSGDAAVLGWTAVLTGAQADPMFTTVSEILGVGWDYRVTKLAGTDRTIPWSIRKVA